MRTYHVYRVVFEDDAAKPAKVEYFVGRSVAHAFTYFGNAAPSGVKREILNVERALANVMNPDAAA